MEARATRTNYEEFSYYLNKINRFTIFEEFWITHEEELPQVAALARSFNIRSAISVASEHLFSVAAYVNRKQHYSLSPDALRYSIILRDADIRTCKSIMNIASFSTFLFISGYMNLNDIVIIFVLTFC